MNAIIHQNVVPPASAILHTVTMEGMNRFEIAPWLFKHGYHTGYIWDSPVGRVLSFREEDKVQDEPNS